MPPVSPASYSNVHTNYPEPRIDATDYISPRSHQPGLRAFVRRVSPSTERFLFDRTSASQSPSPATPRHGFGDVSQIYRGTRRLQVDIQNARDQLRAHLDHQRFTDAVDRRDFQTVHRLWSQQRVSFVQKSPIRGENLGHRIARVDPHSAAAHHTMNLVLHARDAAGQPVPLGDWDDKGRTPAHLAAARNNRAFFDRLIDIAYRDPWRNLGLDRPDYKNRSCDDMASDPHVRAQIDEIRHIQNALRAQIRMQEQQRQVQPEPVTSYKTQLFVQPSVNAVRPQPVQYIVTPQD